MTIEAPRWRLNSAHYLNVRELPDGTKVEWEHRETARETGRTVRKLFPVPMLLDPKDPADCNYPGEIIVTHDVEGAHIPRNDIVFVGQPTPEMEPLNAAAEAITASLRHRWDNPIESLPANGGMTTEESTYMKQMVEAFTKSLAAQAAPQVENQSVPKAEFDALKAELESLKALIAGQANIATKANPAETTRRV